jgi:hypothetical protein
LKSAKKNIPEAPIWDILHQNTGSENNWVENVQGVNNKAGNKKDHSKNGEDVVLDLIAPKVVGTFAKLEKNVGHIMHDKDDGPNSKVATDMRQSQQGNCHKVVNKHDVEVLVVCTCAQKRADCDEELSGDVVSCLEDVPQLHPQAAHNTIRKKRR